jgi:hypothetical protein
MLRGRAGNLARQGLAQEQFSGPEPAEESRAQLSPATRPAISVATTEACGVMAVKCAG